MNMAGSVTPAGSVAPADGVARNAASGHMNQHRGLRILWLLPAAPFLIAGPLTTSAHAATTTGCSGTAVSFSDRGIPLDKVTAPGPSGTQARPLRNMWAGIPHRAAPLACRPSCSGGSKRRPVFLIAIDHLMLFPDLTHSAT